MKWFEWVICTALIMLWVLILQGCSYQSPILSSENARAGFVITKPPIQISYRGDMTQKAQNFTLMVIREINKMEFQDYSFNENHNVRLNSIDAKSDSVNIQLIEGVQVNKDYRNQDVSKD